MISLQEYSDLNKGGKIKAHVSHSPMIKCENNPKCFDQPERNKLQIICYECKNKSNVSENI